MTRLTVLFVSVNCLFLGILKIQTMMCQTDVDDNHDTHFTCSEWLCKNKSKYAVGMSYFKYMGCFCDDLCGFFGDCCSDADPAEQKHLDENILGTVECTHNCYVSKRSYFQAVVKCRENYSNKEISDSCSTNNSSDLFLSVPAASKKTGLIYRNIFCAQCHGEEVYLWKFQITCFDRQRFTYTNETPFHEIISDRRCTLMFVPPEGGRTYRPCHPDIITRCPEGVDSFLQEQCETALTQLVYTDSEIYRNQFCAECNDRSSLGCKKESSKICESDYNPLGSYSLTVLFDVSEGEGYIKHTSIFSQHSNDIRPENVCSGDELFDPFSKTCRSVCSSLLLHGKAECVFKTNVTYPEGPPTTDTMPDCPQLITLNESEFIILEDGGIFVFASNTSHAKENVIRNGNRTHVCVNKTVSDRHPFSTTEGIVSCVGMVLSTVALLMTIVIYAVLKQLRNTPGCNILSLSVALCLANLMMLLAPLMQYSSPICQVFAVAMHYFFLVSFTWMNVIAFDAWSTFGNAFKRVARQTETFKTFVLYSLYAWLIPAVPVITAITMQITMPKSNFSPSYGNGICWIRNGMSLVVFFVVPSSLILLVNIGLFLATGISICKVRRNAGRPNTKDFLVYVKLFVVMGLTWVLSPLSFFVPHPVTTYLYIVVNSLQGLFIGFSFVCTQEVLRSLRLVWRTTRFRRSHQTNGHVAPSIGLAHM